MERRNAWLSYTEAEEKELEQVAKAYRNFLNVGKTERECVTQSCFKWSLHVPGLLPGRR